jgi:hypothetical protein
MPSITRPGEDSNRRSFQKSFSSFSAARNQSQALASSQHSSSVLASPPPLSELNDAFSSVQKIMQTNIDWLKIESIQEPICIITATFPHLILKSSNTLSQLLNLSFSSSDLFGQALHTLLSPQASPSSSVRQTRVGPPLVSPEVMQANKLALDEFYSKLESKSSAKIDSHHEGHFHHCVLTFPSSADCPSSLPALGITCVVYAYPVSYQEILYREYYPGLVSIRPDSIGTNFSSEGGEEDLAHLPPFSFPLVSDPLSAPATISAAPSSSLDLGLSGGRADSLSTFRRKFNLTQTVVPPPTSAPSSFSPSNGVLYYQLHFSKLETTSSPSVEESNSPPVASSATFIGNFVRIFSTSSARSSSGLYRTDTTNTSTSNTLYSQRLISSSSGGRSGSHHEKGSSQRESAATRPSESSGTGTMRSSANNGGMKKTVEQQQQPVQATSDEQQDLEENEETVAPPTGEEPRSEKSFGEYDSLESGLMLERTNTNSSFRSLNTDSGWAHKY